MGFARLDSWFSSVCGKGSAKEVRQSINSDRGLVDVCSVFGHWVGAGSLYAALCNRFPGRSRYFRGLCVVATLSFLLPANSSSLGIPGRL